MERDKQRSRRQEVERRGRNPSSDDDDSRERRRGRDESYPPPRAAHRRDEKRTKRRRRSSSESRSRSRSPRRHRDERDSSPSPESRRRSRRRRASDSSAEEEEERHPPAVAAPRGQRRDESPSSPSPSAPGSNPDEASREGVREAAAPKSGETDDAASSAASALSSAPSFLSFRRRGFGAGFSLARLKAVHEEESFMYTESLEESLSSAEQGGAPAAGAESAASAAAGSRSGLRRGVSRRERGEEEAEKEEDDEQEMKLVLQSMREIQKSRQAHRRKGLDVLSMQEEQQAEQEGEEEGEDDLSGYGLLERNFSTVNSATGATLDKHLEEFLRERMQLKEAPKKEEAEPCEGETRGEGDLYRVPERLQVPDRSGEYKEQLNWLTGLTEVQLPMSVKLKNIEATEKAKRALLKKGEPEAVNDDEDPDAIQRKAFGQRYTWFDPDRRPRARAGDDKALQNFSQRARRAQQNKGRAAIGYG
ncbi:hypothetical protein BESB_000300 [Besnoitia besnoiti]|uniref:Hepatocellular carcinoma-associated antigen 59 n=1 Tax=Besnoitia besnoiti TaxID=94643 RepID=A0A2A9MGP3_BESBE|nr:hypothetical protein BESB_000300 [Besnoitia besnoiti]PFH37688.1 hypothetical protein BESB_000300 [Besnoitia besnoiti]